MSTDRAKDKPVHHSEPLPDATSSTRVPSSTGVAFSAETEISDETLEAVAGGGVANPTVRQLQFDQG